MKKVVLRTTFFSFDIWIKTWFYDQVFIEYMIVPSIEEVYGLAYYILLITLLLLNLFITTVNHLIYVMVLFHRLGVSPLNADKAVII